ncbi:MAG: hypothetical protein IJQ67_03735 [Bacilli bacterium]|nr:hypothetical protein [Bacilli bacterium]
MKKRNLLISSIVALFLLSACGGKNPKTNSDESSVTPVSEESTPVEESSITPASEESLLDSEEESTPVEESVITSEEEEAIEPMNYDDVEQFQITEPNVNDLSDKIAEVIAETLKGFETSAGFDISAKDLSLDLRAKTQKVIHPEEESEDLSEELVSEYVSEMEPVSELTSEAEPIIVEDTINVGIKDVGFNVSLGETILKNEEEDTSNLLGYMELKDTKGTVNCSRLDENGKEKMGVYSLVDNTMELYHKNDKEYLHLSKDLVDTATGVVSTLVDDSMSYLPTMIKMMIPDSGKLCLTGISEYIPVIINDFKEEMMTSELTSLEDESSIFSSISFVDVLLSLKSFANNNGYLVSDLVSIKVTSDEDHFLGIELSVTKDNWEKDMEFLDKLMETVEEELPFEFDIDDYFVLDEISFDKITMVMEAGADKKLDYARLDVEGFSFENEREIDPETEDQATSIYINNASADVEARIRYNRNVASHIPSDEELAEYEKNTINLGAIINLLKNN